MAPRPFIPVPDAIEGEVTFLLGGVYMTNRLFYYWPQDLWPSFPELTIADALGTWVINHYLPVIGNDVLFVHSRARKAQAASDPFTTIPYLGYFGTADTPAMSANVTVRLALSQPRRAGRRVGSIRAIGVPLSAVVENELTPAYRAGLIDAFAWAQEFPTAIGAELGWASYRAGGAWRSEGIIFLTGQLRASLTVGPQRKRLKNTALYP